MPVLVEIAATYVGLSDWISAIATARHAAEVGRLQPRETTKAILSGLYATLLVSRNYAEAGAEGTSLELIEDALSLCEAATSPPYVSAIRFDRILQIQDLCRGMANAAPEEFIARKAAEFARSLEVLLERQDPSRGKRRLGLVRTLVQDKFFGFIRAGATDYFFHVRDLTNQGDWARLAEGSAVAFRPIDNHSRGPRAAEPSLLD